MLLQNDIHIDFEKELELETERLLADSIFKRAPIQRRLLKFLLERTLAGGTPPTQYEVAVDGLGKDEDYDVEGDSYPRVQISRLRRNLDSYYARTQPGHGMRVVLEQGAYRLGLEPFEKPAKTSAVGDAFQAGTAAVARWPLWAGLIVALMVAMALTLYVATSSEVFSGEEPVQAGGPVAKPTTALVIDTHYTPIEAATRARFVNTAERLSEIQLSNSFVSKPLALGRDPTEADYILSLNFGSFEGDTDSVFLAFADDDGDILYTREIMINEDRLIDFSAELEASLVFLTAPTGIIAEAELPDEADALASDYACFLAVESRRNNTGDTADLVAQCLEAFPRSEYRAFWYARRAFASYQAAILSGREIGKSGPAWADLRSAFEADQFNAFANFTAAKVELASGNCEAAQDFITRALERGGSYPALVAAMEANAASCSISIAEHEAMAQRIRTLARYNPSPDPLLHLYLVIGLLGSGDREAARLIAERTIIEDPQGRFEQTSDLLRRALNDPRTARMNREELVDAVYLFVWNEPASERIVETLLR